MINQYISSWRALSVVTSNLQQLTALIKIMKHFFIILLIISTVSFGIFLPYTPGDYDYSAVMLSNVLQFATLASLLLVPLGLSWCITDFLKSKIISEPSRPSFYFGKISSAVALMIILAAALGAFLSHSNFFALIILGVGVFALSKNSDKAKNSKSQSTTHNITAYCFIFIPLSVLLVRMAFLEKAKDKSTNFVINQSEQFIRDIEAYKRRNGHYPISLRSTIEDYKPSICGIERFQYEPNGKSYNLYFEQFSDIPGTREIVMYNRLGEHQMTVHNQDLLRIAPENIFRGYYKVVQLDKPHWKVFYFD